MRPTDVNGVNKSAGEYYHLLYNTAFGVRTCSLRLTNVYGPRQLVKHNRQGFIGWFIRTAVEGGEIQIYGDGSQLRDFVYVDDAADAFLRAGASDACDGEALNVGGQSPVSLRELVALLLEIAGSGNASGTSSGRPRRSPSTSAASTPTPRSSRRRSAGNRRCRSATASRGPSPSTASTWRTTSSPRTKTFPAPYDDASHPLHAAAPRGGGPRGG